LAAGVRDMRDASKGEQVSQHARTRGYVRVPLWNRKGSSVSQPLAAPGRAHHAIAALRLASAIGPLRAFDFRERGYRVLFMLDRADNEHIGAT
jgi:hypothetical protein